MNLRPFIVSAALISLLNLSCQKKDNSSNPCDGLLNESPPTTILLKIVDKTTGENLLTNGRIKDTDVSVVYKSTNQDPKNWTIFKTSTGTNPYNGTLRFSIFNETEGNHPYLIQLGSAGSATLQYTITRKETEDPCKRYAFPMSDVKLTDHAFSLVKEGEKENPKFLLLEL